MWCEGVKEKIEKFLSIYFAGMRIFLYLCIVKLK